MKKIFLLFLTLLPLAENISAQSQGPNNPANASYSNIGCLACPGAEWTNPINVQYADGMDATTQLSGNPLCFQTSCYYSRYLLTRNFGFSIPAGATITGVKAEVLRMSTTSPNVGDSIVQIYTQGFAGNNHFNPQNWTATPMNITYGDSIDLWGLTLTPDSVNFPAFGFQIMIRNTNPNASFSPSSIDHITLTVYYSLSTGIFSQTRATGNFSPYYSAFENSLTLTLVPEAANVYVMDDTGREIYSSAGYEKVFLPDMVPGIYFAVVRSDKKVSVLKFAVIR